MLKIAALTILALNAAAFTLLIALAFVSLVSGCLAPQWVLYNPSCFMLYWILMGLPVSTAVAGIVFWKGRSRTERLARVGRWAAVILLIVWAGFWLGSPIWSRCISYEFHNLDYKVASRDWLIQKWVPPQSRNISAWVKPFRCVMSASFLVSEEDFLAFAKDKQWPLERVSGLKVHNISPDADVNGNTTIVDGWLYQRVTPPEQVVPFVRIFAYDRSREMGFFTQLGD
jgi:hypothetical protein